MADDKVAEVETKTNFVGSPVKDATGEPIQEITTEKGETLEVKTKSNFMGIPVKDAAGNPVKEVSKT